MSQPILTLTLNPAIDGACETDVVRHTHKLRTSNERYDAGGGGINVSRVLARLGSPTIACYLAGGFTGQLLDQLIEAAEIPHLSIPIGDATRISHAVYERSTGREYRFVPEGPHIREGEWRAALDRIGEADFSILVASGSLAPELPEDFYARLQDITEQKGVRMVLDSSGPALERAVTAGGLWMMKPSRGEFEALIGRKCTDIDDMGRTAQGLVARGAAEIVVVTLGHEGALLAHAGGTLCRKPPQVEVQSAVGAGDSFVAGMTHRLAQGWTPERAFLYGMAAGTAAVLTPGNDLCHPQDIERLFAELEKGA